MLPKSVIFVSFLVYVSLFCSRSLTCLVNFNPQQPKRKKLTILVVTIDCIGHVNACAGTTVPLLARGHRVIFMLDEAYRGKLSALGFEEHLIRLSNRADDNVSEVWSNDLIEHGVMGPGLSMEEKYVKIIDVFTLGDNALDTMKMMDKHAKEAIELLKPDLIVIDGYLPPCIYYSGIPWVNNVSVTALAHCSNDADELPPSSSGFPSNSPRDEKWTRFKNLNLMYKYSKKLNDFFEHEMGYPRYPNDRLKPYEDALLSLYACPEEYDYPVMRKKGWFNIEVFNKNVQKEGVELKSLISEEFATNNLDGKWSGKWIYLSMGSMGSVDLDLMDRLLKALGKTDHKIVVSKGPRHQEFDLPRNAWGTRFLPQMSLLPLMDLVITHGGNNTITETFAQGKPMIVLPLFGDQYDNAQRLHETGWAIRLDPYDFAPEQLIYAVQKLLNDEELKGRLKKASKRILSNNRHEELADKIEALWVNAQRK